MTRLRVTFEAIGTRWTIEMEAAPEDEHLLRERIARRIEAFDALYSRFRDDSFVRQFETPGEYPMPRDGLSLIEFYEALYKATQGKVTPLVGSLMNEIGYDPAYSLKAGHPTAPPKWEEALVYTPTTITVKQPIVLDVGAAGKGYLVDLIAELLRENHITDFTINAGGDLRHHSTKNEPIRIGLENPLNTEQVIGVATLYNESLCASSGARRKWGAYTHIIDPHTLESPSTIVATWVIADDAMVADGLATALFFTPASQLQKQFNFKYAVLSANQQLDYSADFPAEVYTA